MKKDKKSKDFLIGEFTKEEMEYINLTVSLDGLRIEAIKDEKLKDDLNSIRYQVRAKLFKIFEESTNAHW